MKIINGRSLAKSIKLEIAQKVSTMVEKPALAAILVGDDPASHLYVKLKEKACKKVGITFHKYLLEENASKEEILAAIDFLNNDEGTDGILVQLPLPNREWEDEIIQALKPTKDVDGFHPQTVKNLLAGDESIIPGLAAGIVHLALSTPENLDNKKALIVCNTEIFATPIQYLLQKNNIISEIVLKDDVELKNKVKNADIIIIAVGHENFLTADMVSENAIIIDVGINENKNAKNGVVGDCDYESFSQMDGYITPVPGGVGPMTVAMLLYNVWKIKSEKLAG